MIMTTAMITKRGGCVDELEARSDLRAWPRPAGGERAAELCRQDRHHRRRLKPGGGYDATARMLARHLPNHLPGKPTVIVQNMPGGNSIIAANHMYAVAKPDGLTIGTFNRNLPIAQLTRVQGVKFDMTKFAWIGSAANEATILAIRNDLPYKNFDELRKAKEPVLIGSTGRGGNTHDFPLLLKDLLGVNLKIVSGYSSSADIMLAIERKEVDGRAGSYT